MGVFYFNGYTEDYDMHFKFPRAIYKVANWKVIKVINFYAGNKFVLILSL